MSNLLNYLTIGKRLGEQISLPYNGNIYTSALDGSVWKAVNGIPLAYSSTYSQLLNDAAYLVTAATPLNGPYTGNKWNGMFPSIIVGATAGGSTWLMVRNTSTSGSPFNYYYTSTDAGATWTQRTFPVTSKNWNIVVWDGTNFVIYANGTGATGVQESTDGITWTARTAISLSPYDLVYAASITTYLAVTSSSTAAATSTDRITSTARTTTTTPGWANASPRGVVVTWNPGAALFVMGTSTNYTYQTSPDGATWTTRLLDTVPAFLSFASVVVASDSTTTTVMVGPGGIVAYGTNCTSWTIKWSCCSNQVRRII